MVAILRIYIYLCDKSSVERIENIDVWRQKRSGVKVIEDLKIKYGICSQEAGKSPASKAQCNTKWHVEMTSDFRTSAEKL